MQLRRYSIESSLAQLCLYPHHLRLDRDLWQLYDHQSWHRSFGPPLLGIERGERLQFTRLLPGTVPPAPRCASLSLCQDTFPNWSSSCPCELTFGTQDGTEPQTLPAVCPDVSYSLTDVCRWLRRPNREGWSNLSSCINSCIVLRTWCHLTIQLHVYIHHNVTKIIDKGPHYDLKMLRDDTFAIWKCSVSLWYDPVAGYWRQACFEHSIFSNTIWCPEINEIMSYVTMTMYDIIIHTYRSRHLLSSRTTAHKIHRDVRAIAPMTCLTLPRS